MTHGAMLARVSIYDLVDGVLLGDALGLCATIDADALNELLLCRVSSEPES